MLFTWKQAKENPHDVSGIDNPEDHLYYKLFSTYYPQPGTAIINDEGLWNDGVMLYEKLDALEGVSDTDYNDHFGRIVLLSLEGKLDTPEKRLEIIKEINDYVSLGRLKPR